MNCLLKHITEGNRENDRSNGKTRKKMKAAIG
jgi:hypothetical protein